MHWNGWSTPVDIKAPPGGDSPTVPDWADLKFNPLGIYNLRRRLGALPKEPGIFMRYKPKFLQSDLAWFSSGLHNDGQHMTPSNVYHQLFNTAREHTGTGEAATKRRNALRDTVRDQVFDTATLWDRAYGGYTMVIHVDGTTQPKAPLLPEYLKAHVYLPPNLLSEFTDSHKPIAQIVQTFIEAIGVPTVMRWRNAAQNNSWSLTQTGPLHTPNTEHLAIIPAPVTPMSSYYIFPGRPYGSLSTISRSPSPQSLPLHQTYPYAVPDNDDLYERDADDEWTEVDGQVTQLRRELDVARETIAEHEETIARLRQEVMTALNKRSSTKNLSERPLSSTSHPQDSTKSVRLQTPPDTIPKVPKSQSFPSLSIPTAQHDTSSSSPVRRPHTPSAVQSKSPISPSKSRSQQKQPLHRDHLVNSDNLAGGLQSFGPSCEEFVDQHNLGDRLHLQIYDLYANKLASKWYKYIARWFPDYDDESSKVLAEGLYASMCQDAERRE